MKNIIKLSLLLLPSFFFHHSVLAHCQVPCGIYTDQLRFEQMLEDQSTIDKASKLIAELSSKKDAQSKNQLYRWVSTKESHASNIQKTIAEYFMIQRIKPSANEYDVKLKSAHAVMVAAIKCKQSIAPENANILKEAILSFHKIYETKK